jgi:hypothetical protein
MQPNSTARTIVNKTLLTLGFKVIASDALYASGILDQYGNLPGGLDKYQQQCVTLLDIFQQAIAMTFNKPSFYRKFVFQTVAPDPVTGVGTPDYDLKNVFIEGFRSNSFFNISYGVGPGNPIRVMPYQQYNEGYARPDIVPIGAPYWLIPLPTDGGEADHCKIKLVPTPDQVYTIEGQCRIIVPPITAGSDQVIFPYRYEHALIMKLAEIMETKLNEGREMSARQYAEQFVAEIFRDASGADEEIDRIDMGIRLWSGRSRSDSSRDYNPSTDSVPQYP